jgi:uncharacterized protein YqgC (DUF456 family)
MTASYVARSWFTKKTAKVTAAITGVFQGVIHG